jgi:hypothetical protein
VSKVLLWVENIIGLLEQGKFDYDDVVKRINQEILIKHKKIIKLQSENGQLRGALAKLILDVEEFIDCEPDKVLCATSSARGRLQLLGYKTTKENLKTLAGQEGAKRE